MNRIIGRFKNRVAYIPLVIGGVEHPEVLVDTGFSGFLTLSESDASRLGARPDHKTDVATFANGTRSFPEAPVKVEWFGREIVVPALVLGDCTIIGMDLLYGTRMVVDEMNGVLTIEPAREDAA